MNSRPDRRFARHAVPARAWVAASMLAACLPALAQARAEAPAAKAQQAAQQAVDSASAQAPSAPQAARWSKAEVDRDIAEVRRDPLLGGTRTVRTLQFKDRDAPKQEKPKPRPNGGLQAFWVWLAQLGRFLTESGRVLLWLLGFAVVGLLLVSLRRLGGWRALVPQGRGAVAPPTHVRDLDIRPETLPADVAGAAQALWRRGENREALSLLYRGALSRLVHRHAVPIRSASTEGDCVRLARQALPAAPAAFFERLVGTWERATYGGRKPDDASVAALCEGFAVHWPPAAAAGASA